MSVKAKPIRNDENCYNVFSIFNYFACQLTITFNYCTVLVKIIFTACDDENWLNSCKIVEHFFIMVVSLVSRCPGLANWTLEINFSNRASARLNYVICGNYVWESLMSKYKGPGSNVILVHLPLLDFHLVNYLIAS